MHKIILEKKNDISSVSLRDIRRFGIFYEFFVGYFKKNKELRDKKENFELIDNFYKDWGKKEIYINSIKLSIYLCYYIRLTKKELRKEFAFIYMNKLFGDNFLEVPEHEQKYIARKKKMNWKKKNL